MIDQTVVQYLGFQSKAQVREYAFTVREVSREPLEYTLSITNEAFVSHRVRYQDAPGICLSRLHRELAASANHPAETHFCVSDTELADYEHGHRQKPTVGFRKNRED